MKTFDNDKRKYVYYGTIISIFMILIVRFFYLQIYKQAQYFRESEKNRIREVVIEPTRGIIVDRNGVVLVDNHPSYSVFAIPFEVQRADSVLFFLSKILKLDAKYIFNKIRKERRGHFTPVKLKRNIDFETLSQIEEYKLELPGVIYKTEPKRCYTSGVKAPHVFGYLGEISKSELERFEKKGYHLGDIVGKKGLEAKYESYLRGQPGYSYVEVDALGREIRNLTEKKQIPPRPGKTLHLSLDAELQMFLEAEMNEMRGGAVVVDCRNGEILALVSKPDYDPELFANPITSEVWKELLNDPDKPLYDRMVQSIYPPGSTFKLVLAAAGLESENLNLNWLVYCPGYMKLGWRTFNCWKAGGHGEVQIFDAIEQSCNVFFYKLSLKVGLDIWAQYARLLGFGRPTGIDLLGENSGLLPDRAYLDKKFGKGGWTKGLILNLSVGQGDLLVTPLQMVALAMMIANEGRYYRLHLVRYIEDPNDGSQIWTPIDSSQVQGISLDTFKLLKQAMYRVVHGEKGTGRAADPRICDVAGKTGTAQNPHGEDHAWFIGFAPYEAPQIAYCVLVENGGSGGAVAAPIARKIVQKWLQQQKPSKKSPIALENKKSLTETTPL